jgi:hypothetical protein
MWQKKLPTIDFICEQMGHLHMANMILDLLLHMSFYAPQMSQALKNTYGFN